MLFNSGIFLLYFLPIVFIAFAVISNSRLHRLSGFWLTGASLAFYGWWRPENLPLLLISIVANYAIGAVLRRNPNKIVLIAAIVGNVAALGYFKYAGFLVANSNELLNTKIPVPSIILPLAISFFTFQQIAYLVDANDGDVSEHGFVNYCLFITFFPHLIAGPITHHREMLSQFADPQRFRARWDFIAPGVTLFLVGLVKKVLIADPFGTYATPIFKAAAVGKVAAVEAWGGALSYALQIYFDFSGYSDMAIGLGLMFGIALPANFNSPFKARNIIDFWARWHMTLTRFLTTYVYTPIVIAQTRRRAQRGLPLPRAGRMTIGVFIPLVAMPTMFTLLVSGVWHGAGWQFVVFGLLHGSYLVVAHGWRAWKTSRRIPLDSDNPLVNGGSVVLTFLCVVVALVFFRAADVRSALNLLAGMAGLNGVALPPAFAHLPGMRAAIDHFGLRLHDSPLFGTWEALRIGLFLLVVWMLPNSNQWLRDYHTALGFKGQASWLDHLVPAARWRPQRLLGIGLGAVSAFAILIALSSAPSEFIYYQF